MLTSDQLRGARAMARMAQKSLAEAAGISVETIKRLEGRPGPLSANVRTVSALQSALEAAGIEFIDEPAKPGVLLKRTDVAADEASAGHEMNRTGLPGGAD